MRLVEKEEEREGLDKAGVRLEGVGKQESFYLKVLVRLGGVGRQESLDGERGGQESFDKA